MLRTPPHEVVSRGFESVKAYLKRLAGGFTECRRTKLMVVGLGGAGKTRYSYLFIWTFNLFLHKTSRHKTFCIAFPEVTILSA